MSRSDIKTRKDEVSASRAAFAGAVSGAATRAIAQPLDVLKVRFQLQLEPIKHGSTYSSVFQATSSIVKEEGFTALWSGHIPAQYLSVTYGVVQFTIFEKLLILCRNHNNNMFNSHRHSVNFVSGGIAATVATVVSFPFDTVRTRLIAEKKTQKAYKGFTNATLTMVRNEGGLSLFKGLLPTLGQIAPHAGVQFAVYKLFTDNILINLSFFQKRNNVLGTIELTMLANLIAGSIAGFAGKAVIYPFDLLKKRLQIQGFQEHRGSFGRQMYCKGMINCIQLTVKEEGVLALYKGFWPSLIKAVLVSALHFAIYDEIKHYVTK